MEKNVNTWNGKWQSCWPKIILWEKYCLMSQKIGT